MIARLEATGLYHLRDCFLKRMNKNLMLAFVERWQPETNSFHMPWGEMTITLHDVAFILGLRLDGPAVSEICPVEECSQSLASVLGVGLMDTNDMFRNKGVGWVKVRDQLTLPSATDEKKMKGYLMFLLGSVLFVDKTACNMKPWWIHFTNDLDNVGKYSWASACLANMYRQLGIATRAGMNSLCGCVILLLVRVPLLVIIYLFKLLFYLFIYSLVFVCSAGSLSISPAFDHLFPVHMPSLSLDAEGGPMVEAIKPRCRNTGKYSTP
ncbi:PREDICTED: serine/threonine-protein phosphatase 7 long form homolog [Erythranthe guttata]|uniref:serine/threonine-protein phosphatase 7 long form homolog n=1 Tax=Erythranthe guttata TaxID=4155 RepID=UPI00064D7730|nr:PREDICTED: serine/threonine-protein phosphatase 7 long form homolog [Erythranthe guttata]|eukprot:XP_012831219.1 PREDICTED: serine/threonine-protein phosphatase 7 long form homolog [Erythranthe guttata]